MLWIKAFHIIFVITWFAGLIYLPRLFVYHAMSQDAISHERFKIMERKLYYGIMTPSGILATILGIWLFLFNSQLYLHSMWMLLKLALVLVLWIYHFGCDYYRHQFLKQTNTHTHFFYRWFNEVPVVVLITVVILAIVQPFSTVL